MSSPLQTDNCVQNFGRARVIDSSEPSRALYRNFTFTCSSTLQSAVHTGRDSPYGCTAGSAGRRTASTRLQVAVIGFDLSAVFETVNHETLCYCTDRVRCDRNAADVAPVGYYLEDGTHFRAWPTPSPASASTSTSHNGSVR